jgi:hypothetical protein
MEGVWVETICSPSWWMESVTGYKGICVKPGMGFERVDCMYYDCTQDAAPARRQIPSPGTSILSFAIAGGVAWPKISSWCCTSTRIPTRRT